MCVTKHWKDNVCQLGAKSQKNTKANLIEKGKNRKKNPE